MLRDRLLIGRNVQGIRNDSCEPAHKQESQNAGGIVDGPLSLDGLLAALAEAVKARPDPIPA